MTFKIRKLYNVLVVGGMAAAGLGGCEKKKDPPKAETTADPAPANAEPPAEPTKAEPAKAEPVAAEPTETAEPVAAEPTETAEPTEAAKPTEAKPAVADTKAAPTTGKKTVKKTVKATDPKEEGGGAKGWS